MIQCLSWLMRFLRVQVKFIWMALLRPFLKLVWIIWWNSMRISTVRSLMKLRRILSRMCWSKALHQWRRLYKFYSHINMRLSKLELMSSGGDQPSNGQLWVTLSLRRSTSWPEPSKVEWDNQWMCINYKKLGVWKLRKPFVIGLSSNQRSSALHAVLFIMSSGNCWLI